MSQLTFAASKILFKLGNNAETGQFLLDGDQILCFFVVTPRVTFVKNLSNNSVVFWGFFYPCHKNLIYNLYSKRIVL